MACIIDSWVPTYSSTESAPIPLVSSFIRATPSAPRSVTMSVAPNSRASFCRDSWRLMAIIRSAPICLADRTPRSPTAPSPTTATVLPGFTLAASAANHPVPITVGESQQARDQLRRRSLPGGDQRSVGERHTQPVRLRTADELAMLAGGVVAGLAVGTRVVRGEERTDDELARLDLRDGAADLLDDAAVLVPYGGRLGDLVDAAIVPEVGPAHAGCRHPDDGIRRLQDLRVVALLEAHVPRAIQDSSSHVHLLAPGRCAPVTRSTRGNRADGLFNQA